MRASEQIIQAVSSWPGVTVGPGDRGASIAFRVGRRELGHLHGDHAAHFSFLPICKPNAMWNMRWRARLRRYQAIDYDLAKQIDLSIYNSLKLEAPLKRILGASKITAKGDVYFLKNVEDFAGLYSAATAGATIGKGAGASQYENNKGVFLKVQSKSEGLALTLGLGGVQVDFVK